MTLSAKVSFSDRPAIKKITQNHYISIGDETVVSGTPLSSFHPKISPPLSQDTTVLLSFKISVTIFLWCSTDFQCMISCLRSSKTPISLSPPYMSVCSPIFSRALFSFGKQLKVWTTHSVLRSTSQTLLVEATASKLLVNLRIFLGFQLTLIYFSIFFSMCSFFTFLSAPKASTFEYMISNVTQSQPAKYSQVLLKSTLYVPSITSSKLKLYFLIKQSVLIASISGFYTDCLKTFRSKKEVLALFESFEVSSGIRSSLAMLTQEILLSQEPTIIKLLVLQSPQAPGLNFSVSLGSGLLMSYTFTNPLALGFEGLDMETANYSPFIAHNLLHSYWNWSALAKKAAGWKLKLLRFRRGKGVISSKLKLGQSSILFGFNENSSMNLMILLISLSYFTQTAFNFFSRAFYNESSSLFLTPASLN